MKHMILSILTSLSLVLSPALAFSAVASAACGGTNSDAKGQVLTGISANTTNTDCTGTGVKNTVATIVNILSFLVGVISLVAIISGGFKYITSGGEAAKVGNAKNTILYALVGIIIVVLAQVIVRVVVNDTTGAATSCPSGQHHLDPTDDLSACVT